MTDYPYIQAWAVYLKLGPEWMANTISRAKAENAPHDTWGYSVALQRWSTLSDLDDSARHGNKHAQRTYKALVTIGKIIAEDTSALSELMDYAEQEGIWQ